LLEFPLLTSADNTTGSRGRIINAPASHTLMLTIFLDGVFGATKKESRLMQLQGLAQKMAQSKPTWKPFRLAIKIDTTAKGTIPRSSPIIFGSPNDP